MLLLVSVCSITLSVSMFTQFRNLFSQEKTTFTDIKSFIYWNSYGKIVWVSSVTFALGQHSLIPIHIDLALVKSTAVIIQNVTIYWHIIFRFCLKCMFWSKQECLNHNCILPLKWQDECKHSLIKQRKVYILICMQWVYIQQSLLLLVVFFPLLSSFKHTPNKELQPDSKGVKM